PACRDQASAESRPSCSSHGQPLATLVATALERQSPGAGAHPSAEPMGPGSLALFRLISAFHDSLPADGSRPVYAGNDRSLQGQNASAGTRVAFSRALRQGPAGPLRPPNHRWYIRPAGARLGAHLIYRSPNLPRRSRLELPAQPDLAPGWREI